ARLADYQCGVRRPTAGGGARRGRDGACRFLGGRRFRDFQDFRFCRGSETLDLTEKCVAGAPGFEPGITEPKSVALPLGHAPSRAGLRSRRNYPTAIVSSRCPLLRGGG